MQRGEATMCNNSTCFSLDNYLNLCSLDGIAKNRSSVFQAVALSASVVIAVLSPDLQWREMRWFWQQFGGTRLSEHLPTLF